jgi:hypothetical protein
MKKLTYCIIFTACLYITKSNAADVEDNAMTALFQQVQDSEELDIEGQVCYDYVGDKGWSDGFNSKSDGTSFYVSVGVSNVKAPWTSANFTSSLMNASIESQLKTKSNMAQSLSKRIASEIVSQMEQNYNEGKAPQLLTDELVDFSKNYESLSYIDKAKVLIHQELDELISDEQKQNVDERSSEAKAQIQKISELINSSSFSDKITANSNATIRGLKSVFSSFDTVPRNGKTTVCTVGIWSEKLASRVDAITTGNFDLLKNQKPGKPLQEYIPNEKTEQGYQDLLGTFGTFTVRDENGHITILSFAQEGIKGKNGEQMALTVAQMKAERAIIQLRQEHIDVIQASNNIENTSEYADGLVDYYSSSNHESRISASANGLLVGQSMAKRWKGLHLNRKPFVGVVVAWSPSQAEMAASANSALAKKPSMLTSSGGEMPKQNIKSQNSLGDDDEDF